MSDDLIARLRDHVNHRGGPSIEGGSWAMMLTAADALEAQAKEIEELKKELNAWHESANWPEKSPGQMRARIAELEAALKPFEEKSSKSLADAEKLAANEGYELPDDQTAEDIYAWALALTWGDLRAARAKLNGEKG